MQIYVKVILEDQDGVFFMGSGLVALLEGIDRNRSVRAAAREMSLSYPKALRMIRTVESGLGTDIVTRRKGGHERGGAELTPQGKVFLRRFERLQQRVRRFADGAFARAFDEPLAGSASRAAR